MHNKELILHLSLLDGIGPATIQTLLRKSDLFADLYRMHVIDLIHHYGLSQKIAQTIITGLQDTKILEQELTRIKHNNINWTVITADNYPLLLKEIYMPPVVLYWYGASLENNQSIAIVGSRKANYYAERVINNIVPTLVANQWTIVSGGALGADSMAHHATLQARGKTVVVLGSGLLHPYPRSNKKLFDAVVQNGGTLLSSFSLSTHAMPGNFPARNRIIAGLSRGCIVAQAAEKSGARITAQFALEQGREVFAIPGPIDDPLSVGCHRLIQEGAKLTTMVQDILVEFGQDNVGNQKIQQSVAVDSIEGHIIQACRQPCSIDDLARVTGLSLAKIQEALFTLQLDGRVQQDFTGMWLAQ